MMYSFPDNVITTVIVIKCLNQPPVSVIVYYIIATEIITLLVKTFYEIGPNIFTLLVKIFYYIMLIITLFLNSIVLFHNMFVCLTRLIWFIFSKGEKLWTQSES